MDLKSEPKNTVLYIEIFNTLMLVLAGMINPKFHHSPWRPYLVWFSCPKFSGFFVALFATFYPNFIKFHLSECFHIALSILNNSIWRENGKWKTFEVTVYVNLLNFGICGSINLNMLAQCYYVSMTIMQVTCIKPFLYVK